MLDIGQPLTNDVNVFRGELYNLKQLLVNEDQKEMLQLINRLVPDYRSVETH